MQEGFSISISGFLGFRVWVSGFRGLWHLKGQPPPKVYRIMDSRNMFWVDWGHGSVGGVPPASNSWVYHGM